MLFVVCVAVLGCWLIDLLVVCFAFVSGSGGFGLRFAIWGWRGG